MQSLARTSIGLRTPVTGPFHVESERVSSTRHGVVVYSARFPGGTVTTFEPLSAKTPSMSIFKSVASVAYTAREPEAANNSAELAVLVPVGAFRVETLGCAKSAFQTVR